MTGNPGERLTALSNPTFGRMLNPQALSQYGLEVQRQDLNIVTVNMQMFSGIVASLNGSPSPGSKTSRFTDFLTQTGIADADIIAFQEAFDPGGKIEIRDKLLEDHGFTSLTDSPRTNASMQSAYFSLGSPNRVYEGFAKFVLGVKAFFEGKGLSGMAKAVHTEDGGTFIAGNYPMEEVSSTVFKTKATGFDAHATKGWNHIRIKVGDKFFHIINTHLQSEYGTSAPQGGERFLSSNSEIRQSQLQEIRNFIDGITKTHPEEQVILTGDLNVDPRSVEYASLFGPSKPLNGFVSGRYADSSEVASYPGDDTILDHVLLHPSGVDGHFLNRFETKILTNNLANGNEFTDHRPVQTMFSFLYTPADWEIVKISTSMNYTQLSTSGENVCVFTGYGEINYDSKTIELHRGDNIVAVGEGFYNINGGSGNEKIITDGGVIIVDAWGGDDWIEGGLIPTSGVISEEDFIRMDGGGGNDWLFTGVGTNVCIGGPGSDNIVMTTGNVRAYGGDRVYARDLGQNQRYDQRTDTFWLDPYNADEKIIYYFENNIDKLNIISNGDISFSDIRYEDAEVPKAEQERITFLAPVAGKPGVCEPTYQGVRENMVTLYYMGSDGQRHDIVDIIGLHSSMFFPNDINIVASADLPQRLPDLFVSPEDYPPMPPPQEVQTTPPQEERLSFAQAKASRFDSLFNAFDELF